MDGSKRLANENEIKVNGPDFWIFKGMNYRGLK